MEARVALGLSLVIALSLISVLVVMTRSVNNQATERAAADLQDAGAAFHELAASRAAFAAAQTRLITELPIFRAHMTDVQLAADRATLDAMADEYRRQLNAQFCIVTDRTGKWVGAPGWNSREAPPALLSGIAAALAGQSRNDIVALDARLVLVVSEPARFAEETLGTLTVGFVLDDAIAKGLAGITRAEVNLLAGRSLSGSSLPARARTEFKTLFVSGGSLFVPRKIDGVPYIARTFSLFPDRPSDSVGHLVLLADWRPTQQFLSELRQRVVFAGLATFALALIGGLIFSRRTSRPLREIAAAAEDIAAGDWSRQVPVVGSAEATTMAVAFNDMSKGLRHAQERLLHDALHDHLTALPNRALFRDRLEQVIARTTRQSEYTSAVLFLDLDRFKAVNDSLGHPAGDRLLLDIGQRLKEVLGNEGRTSPTGGAGSPNDSPYTLARIGGDEFTVLLEGLHDPSDAVRIAERIREAIAAPVELDGHQAFITASIGIVITSGAQRSGEDVLRDADIAMYRAKDGGGDRCAVFDTSMHRRAVERLQVETDLRHAFERREFTLRYQPIVTLSDRRVVGFEALLRWEHPRRGTLLPTTFLKVAEDTGLIVRLDQWVLREACTQARRWQGSLLTPVSVSVNISAQGFHQPDIVGHVADTLARTGLNPQNLRLEITEGTAMADPERARVTLTELRALGVRISLDDFGTGYSSLSYLQRFPVDTLKIDRTFVAGLGHDADCLEIIRTIMNLARTLGLDVIAEGMETSAQVDALEELACTFGQGYFFSRPLAPEEFGALPHMNDVSALR